MANNIQLPYLPYLAYFDQDSNYGASLSCFGQSLFSSMDANNNNVGHECDESIKQSPGTQIRRLAENFLNSISNENSPQTQTHSLALHNETITAASKANTCNTMHMHKPCSMQVMVKETDWSEKNEETSEQQWQNVHEDIENFAINCRKQNESEATRRRQLAARISTAIKAVWPSAIVDLVGSSAYGIALSKSDLDFVIYFPVSPDPPVSLSLISEPIDDALNLSMKSGIKSIAANVPFYTSAETCLSDCGVEHCIKAKQHFVSAGSLIKLIGGRKMAKILFRSTKIQVFKDINLIRLRDGLLGTSIDLWFPTDEHTTFRSQHHSAFIQLKLEEYPAFFPLACVLKTFFQQNMLNSGYSGLGSYGILLMIVSFLQRTAQHSPNCLSEQANLGKLLYSFFKMFCEFNYRLHALRVTGNGSLIDKPDYTLLPKPKRKIVLSRAETVCQLENRESDEHDEYILNEFEDMLNEDGRGRLRRRALGGGKFTLIIEDPIDSTNYIICHHKALRNMVLAFRRACKLLDPQSPLPQLPTSSEPTQLTVANDPTAAISSSSDLNDQLDFSVDPNDPQTRFMSISDNGFVDHNTGSKSCLSRLINLQTAFEGPSTKPCFSAMCGGRTMCPVQNKICFTCGQVFAKPFEKNKSKDASFMRQGPLNESSRIQSAWSRKVDQFTPMLPVVKDNNVSYAPQPDIPYYINDSSALPVMSLSPMKVMTYPASHRLMHFNSDHINRKPFIRDSSSRLRARGSFTNASVRRRGSESLATSQPRFNAQPRWQSISSPCTSNASPLLEQK